MWSWFGLGCALAIAGGDASSQTEGDPLVDAELFATEALAEYNRLADEVERLATRNAWSGVERHFLQLVDTGVAPSFDDWMRGAHAARALGDIRSAKSRLLQAKTLREDPDVFNWLYEIDSHYGEVFLVCDPGSHILLEAESMPFDPVQRRAVEHARTQVIEGCAFEGLLPHGTYAFFGRELVVSAAQSERRDLRGVEITRKRRKELDRAWKKAREAEVSGS